MNMLKRFRQAGTSSDSGGNGRRRNGWHWNAPVCFGGMMVLLFFLSLGLRTMRYWMAPNPSRDAILYLNIAREWCQNSFEFAYRNARYSSPLFIRIMKFGIESGIGPERCALIWNMVLGSLIPLLFAGICRRLFRQPGWALTAGVLAATHPELVQLSVELQRETSYLFFSMLGYYWLLAVWHTPRLRQIGAAGATGCFALAFMSRFEALQIMLVLILFVVFTRYREHRTWNDTIRFIGIIGCTWVAAVLLFSMLTGVPISYYPSRLIPRIFNLNQALL